MNSGLIEHQEASIDGHIGMGNNHDAQHQPNQSQFRSQKPKSDNIFTTDKLSLEDTIRENEVKGGMKTPVSILQEHLSRQGITPSYQLVQIERACHEPTFHCRVSFNDKGVPFTAMGAGCSKIEAIHSAASALIDKLTGLHCPTTSQEADELNATGNTKGDRIVANPIGWLQEMCTTRRWPQPTYKTEMEVGLPHDRIFTISCTIVNFREIGKGTSKKIAKRSAANQMYTRLKDHPLDMDANQISDSLQSAFDEKNRNNSNTYGDLKGINFPSLTGQHGQRVAQFHKTLENSVGKNICKLQTDILPRMNSGLIEHQEASIDGHIGMGNNHDAQHQPNQSQFRSQKPKSDNIFTTDKLSLEDTIRENEVKGGMKTPVSILQEHLSRQGITPSYQLVQIEGVCQPTFRYRVSFNDKGVPFTAMGAGRSKIEAIHSAASALIEKLTGLHCPTTSREADELNATENTKGDRIVANPIGWLQEMCTTRRWPQPTYKTEMEVGLPHDRIFTISCTIVNFREIGKGTSKKIAKRSAANQMYTRLKDHSLDMDANQISNSLQSAFDEKNRNNSNTYGDLKGINFPSLTGQHGQRVAQFHKTLENSVGKNICKLQKTCLKDSAIDCIKLLEEVAIEN